MSILHKLCYSIAIVIIFTLAEIILGYESFMVMALASIVSSLDIIKIERDVEKDEKKEEREE